MVNDTYVWAVQVGSKEVPSIWANIRVCRYVPELYVYVCVRKPVLDIIVKCAHWSVSSSHARYAVCDGWGESPCLPHQCGGV